MKNYREIFNPTKITISGKSHILTTQDGKYVVKEKKKILKQNRDTFCKDHTFDRTTTFDQIKKEMKKEYE